LKLRKGKWSKEEEKYALKLTQFFSKGLLSVPQGTSLRGLLAELLHCEPMRITKKVGE
jgi:hypothetical protein